MCFGTEENLVGRSHECDYPKTIQILPECTKLKLDISGSSLAINKSVNLFLNNSSSIYQINEEIIIKLKPDIIFTDQCDVCAVSLREVNAIFENSKRLSPEIISLQPSKIDDIWGT